VAVAELSTTPVNEGTELGRLLIGLSPVFSHSLTLVPRKRTGSATATVVANT
jgi:hypothetical protein